MNAMDTSPARRLTVGVVLAIIGAGVLAAVLFALGAFGASTPAATASTQSDPTSGSASLSGPLDAPALYTHANPSIVDITAIDSSTSGDTGTGFLIDSHGHVLTADHVVIGAKSVTVKFADGVTVPATVAGQDESTDVAVLKVTPSPADAPALRLGSTSQLVVGDSLAVIGNPFGYNRSLSTGVVSALDRTIQAPNEWLIPHALQTDAIINPGNSGGPVLDAYLGLATGQSITSTPGALVQSVASGSPSAAVGLRTGDLITAIDGTAIHGPSALVATIAAHDPGQKLTLTVQRGSTTLTVTATLSTQPTTPSTSG